MSQVGSTWDGFEESFDGGEEISWVGECPWNEGFCYGTESGKLLVPRIGASVPLKADLYPLVESGEPINGVAFRRDYLAASTREEVVLYHVPSLPRMTKIKQFDGGAHGVVACSTGGFVAPMGVNGLFFMEANEEQRKITTRTFQTVGSELDFYKIINLGELEHADLFVCAVRGNGLLTLQLSNGAVIGGMGSIDFAGLDIVDVCGLRSPEWPFGAAGLGIDRTILLTRDVFEATRPTTLQLGATAGTPYTILCADGHLMVLTSTALIVVPDLVTRFLAGESLSGDLGAWFRPDQAVDAYLVRDRLVLILADRLVFIPIDQLRRTNATHSSEITPQIINPPWEFTQVPAQVHEWV